jgi:hypothetical protein
MHIIASNGRFLTAESGGGLNGDPARGPARNDALVADRTAADLARFGDAWQQFTIVHNPDGTVALQIGPWFVTAERGGGSYVSTDRDVNEAWQRFAAIEIGDGIAFRCSDGTHYLRVRTDLARPVVDASGTANMGAAITFTTDVPPIAALRADGVTLRNASGSRVSLCGYDMFTALRIEIDDPSGARLQPLLEESRIYGFRLWRVFGQASRTENGYYDLRPTEPGYYEALGRLGQRLTANGIYLLHTCYADNQVIKSGPDHWTRTADALRPYQEGVFLSGGNEWQKNGFDPASLPNPHLKWWSRGSGVGDAKPATPNGATFVEFHPRRDYPKALDDTVASATFIQYTYGFNQPLIIDEPPRMGDDGSADIYADPDICWQFARHYSTQCAGAVFHARPGQTGVLIPPGSATAQCAQMWVAAFDGVATPDGRAIVNSGRVLR